MEIKIRTRGLQVIELTPKISPANKCCQLSYFESNLANPNSFHRNFENEGITTAVRIVSRMPAQHMPGKDRWSALQDLLDSLSEGQRDSRGPGHRLS